jgi:cysteinyl-tRNA synthetase
VSSERPDVPWPTYPPDLPAGATEEQREARLKLIHKLWEESPKPIHLLEEGSGSAASRDEADEAAQKWVLSRMETYRRAEPLHRYTDDEVDNLVATFDLARRSLDFARVDEIRGLLKAQGIVLEEGESIGNGGTTSWKRV